MHFFYLHYFYSENESRLRLGIKYACIFCSSLNLRYLCLNFYMTMIQNERDIRCELVAQACKQMMVAARTAPKGKGIDIIEMAVVTGDDDINRLSEEMLKIAGEKGLKFFLRDADNILQADAIMIIGTRQQPHGLNCAHCGYATCGSKPSDIPCALNMIDLGIAIGSACATASDLRVDTRVMFSAGLAAQRLKMLGDDCGQIMAIPVSATSKNPFFDRKPKEQQPENSSSDK